ncbi:DUF2933 domain-containing protein [Priestia koreensis]|nr:DUF2933 domain-containing protein [Priestia koreensis]
MIFLLFLVCPYLHLFMHKTI